MEAPVGGKKLWSIATAIFQKPNDFSGLLVSFYNSLLIGLTPIENGACKFTHPQPDVAKRFFIMITYY